MAFNFAGRSIGATIALIWAATMSSVHAQEPTSESQQAAPQSGATVLDEITIYGAKDALTLQGTGASVGIVTSEDISDSQLRTMEESFRAIGKWIPALVRLPSGLMTAH